MNQKITKILQQFQIPGELIGIEENCQGNINSTYLVTFRNGNDITKYLLQKINSYVFKEPYLVMKNIELVTNHIKAKLENLPNTNYQTLSFVHTIDNLLLYTHINPEGEKEYYRMYEYIDNCVSYNNFSECEDASQIAYQTGKCFGFFHKLLSDFPVNLLADTIPNFHNTPNRFQSLLSAIENGVTNRSFEVPNEIVYLISQIKNYSIIWNNLGKTIPVRVTHNDTKLNNVLIDSSTNKGIAVIDLDTVMPGSVLFDIGDGIRSACSNSFEDETDPEKIFLNLELTKSYLQGYLEETANFLTADEVKYIGLSIRVLTYELTLRFLTDYINNDVYFKIKYRTHNKDRFSNQFLLLKDMETKAKEIDSFINQLYLELK